MKNGQRVKRMAALLVAALMLVSVFTGCGAKQEEKNGSDAASQTTAATQETTKVEEPTEISIMSLFWTPEPPAEDNPVLKEIEKRTNTKLTITWATNNNYTDKQNVTLASGDMPDLMFIGDPYAPNVQGMEKQGAFWDISPYLKDYPNLMKFPEVTWKYIKSEDGKIYGIPRVRPTDGNNAMLLRKDWLDALQLPVPQTTDDLLAVWKAFAEKDPDGNGQKDTVGYTGSINTNDLGNTTFIEAAFTAGQYGWALKDGKLVSTALEPEVKSSLEYLSKSFKEGMIVKDFPVMKPSQAKELITQGKAGSIVDGMNQAWTLTVELRKTNPKAEFVVLPYLQGPSGIKFSPKGSGSYGKYVTSKKVSEEKLKKILAFMDYGASEEGSDLANYGVLDVHYNVTNGFKIPTEQGKKDNVSSNTFGQIFNKFDKYFRAFADPTTPPEMIESYKKVIDEMEKVSIENPATGLYSDANVKFGSEYSKKINDMKLKIIIGKEPITAWDKFVNELKADANYMKIVEEMAAAYSARTAAK